MNIPCDQHDEIFTNFCCNLKCLKPLCPDCINQHNKYHFSRNEMNEYDTIKRVIQNSDKKLCDFKEGLQKQLERINESENLHVENIINELKDDLFKVKDIILNQMNIFFQELEKGLLESLKKSNVNLDFTDLINNIENEINDTEEIISDLNNDNGFNSLKLAIKKNSDDLFERIKNEVDKKIESKINLPLQIVLNKNKIENFSRIMDEIIYLQDKTIYLNQNNKEDLYYKETNKKFKQNNEYFQSKFK